MASQKSTADRFWAKVNKTNTCWNWTAVVKGGYGDFFVSTERGRSAAHRFSYEQAHGQIPPGMKVCHRCDNMLCVRPDHLFLGTQSDNIRDMYAKGRWPLHRYKRTHCSRGHKLTANEMLPSGRNRECLACRREKRQKKERP